MRKLLILLAVSVLLGACGYVSEYEKAVYDWEPVYCYKSLAGVQCHDTPNHRDERRLVNYFGPDPSRYDRPKALPEPQLSAPPPIDFYVRDPEPVPEPAPRLQACDLPWKECAPATATPVSAPVQAPVQALAEF